MPNAPRQFKPRGQSTTPRKPWHSEGPDLRKGLRGRKLQETKRRILERDDYTCQQCKKLVEYDDSKLDHTVPLTRGGTHDDSNLATLCNKCHDKKSQRESNGV